MGKIRVGKIIANAGEAFFVTLAGVLTVDALAQIGLEPYQLVITALVPAIIQFGLSFCREWAKAEEGNSTSINPVIPAKIKLVKVLDYLVLGD